MSEIDPATGGNGDAREKEMALASPVGSPPQSKEEASSKIRKVLMTIPQLVKLLMGLVRDPRVPTRNKLVFGGILLYLVSPIDLIPDWLPGIGKVDDIMLVALGLNAMLNQVPEEVLSDHWEGDESVLLTLRGLLEIAAMFVPEKIRDRVLGESREQGANPDSGDTV